MHLELDLTHKKIEDIQTLKVSNSKRNIIPKFKNAEDLLYSNRFDEHKMISGSRSTSFLFNKQKGPVVAGRRLK
jgi:hypothetical protein